MRKVIDSFRTRLAALRADENGMEAAQVILILVLVVIGLLPVLNLIKNAISSQGVKVASGISNAS